MPTNENLNQQLSVLLRSTFNRIKSGLPSNYVQLVRERLETETGKKWSSTYISQVVSETNPRNNNQILGACISLITESNLRKLQVLLDMQYAENGKKEQSINGNKYKLTDEGWQLIKNS